MKAIINPDWVNARYEYEFRTAAGKKVDVPYPVRGNRIVDGKIADPIPRWILQPEGDATKPDDGLPEEQDED